MATAQKDSGLPIPGILAVLLLAAGVFVQQLPLERTRPVATTKPTEVLAEFQSVPARLWQDPFEAARKDWESLLARGEPGRKEFDSKVESFRRNLDAILAGTCDDRKWNLWEFRFGMECKAELTVLGVVIFGGGYTESAESRRRNRYAVLSALNVAGLRPWDAEHIDYFPVGRTRSALRPPGVVPYELFVSRARDINYYNSQKQAAEAQRLVLVLWLNEDATRRPVGDFAALLGRLRLSGRVKETVNAKLILAAGSDALQRAISESTQDVKTQAGPPIEVLSATSTVTNEFLQLSADANKDMERLNIRRTIGNDEQLAGALIGELALQGIRPGCRSRSLFGSKRADLLLVTEWDTNYGRALPEAFANVLRNSTCGSGGARRQEAEAEWLHRANYMRGLDGELPEELPLIGTEPKKGGTDAKGGSGEPAKPTPQALAGSSYKERAEGNSQFDYVRRLDQRIAEIGARIAQKDGEIRAIGVLGSDYYDKLLILRALRKHYPMAIFFTTDLDARLLQEDQYPFTHNLLVASHFGLELTESLQGSMPPFRDSYQTSTFFASQLALTCKDGIATEFLEGYFGSPPVYEIGRKGFVKLTNIAAMHAPPSVCAQMPSGSAIAPASRYQQDVSRYLWSMLFYGAGLVLVALYVSSRAYKIALDAVKRRPFVAALLLVATALLYYLFKTFIFDAPDEEPFALFEGVSIWISDLLRLVALALAVFFLCKSASDLDLSDKKLSADFFPDPSSAAERSTADRKRAEAATAQAAKGRRAKDSRARTMKNFFLPWNYEDFSEATARGTKRVTPRGLWKAYLALGAQRLCVWRALIGTVIFLAIGSLLVMNDLPPRPVRGSISNVVDLVITSGSIFAYLFLVFYAADAVRICKSFVKHLASAKSEWDEKTVERFVAAEGKDPSKLIDQLKKDNYLRDYIDMRLIAERTEVVSSIIYYPFLVLLLLIVARSPLFDNWVWHLPILALLGFSAGIIVLSAHLLSAAAEEARGVGLRRMNIALLKAKAAEDKIATDLLTHAIEAVRNAAEGAYRPFTQQPIVRALLIPFGGYGGLAIVEYLLLGAAG
jgi:hypothetical protein